MQIEILGKLGLSRTGQQHPEQGPDGATGGVEGNPSGQCPVLHGQNLPPADAGQHTPARPMEKSVRGALPEALVLITG